MYIYIFSLNHVFYPDKLGKTDLPIKGKSNVKSRTFSFWHVRNNHLFQPHVSKLSIKIPLNKKIVVHFPGFYYIPSLKMFLNKTMFPNKTISTSGKGESDRKHQ